MDINGMQARYRQSNTKLEELLKTPSTSSKMSSPNNNTCIICQNNYEQSICRPSGISQRVFNSCTKHLHSAITEDSFKDVNNREKQLPLCMSCFDSALELNQLSEQLEKFQRKINNVILTFSLKILHRRGQTKSGTRTERQNVDVDVSLLALSSSQLSKFGEGIEEVEDSSEFYMSPAVVDVDENSVEYVARDSKPSREYEDNAGGEWQEDDSVYVGFLPNSDEVEINEQDLESGAPITTFSSYYDTNVHLEPNRVYSVDGASQMVMPPEGEDYQLEEVEEYADEEDQDEQQELAEKPKVMPTLTQCNVSRLPNGIIVRHKNNCSKCGKICSTSYNLLLHEKACTGRTKYLACHLCGNTFSKRSALNRHFKSIHNINLDGKQVMVQTTTPIARVQQNSIAVPSAPTVVKAESTNAQHQFKFKPPVAIRPKPVMIQNHCKKCGKSCSTDYNLALHERACTGKKTVIPCKLCGRVFNMHSALLRHTRTVHSQERPYKCSACPKRFNRNEFLRNHFNRAHATSDPIPSIFHAAQGSSSSSHFANI